MVERTVAALDWCRRLAKDWEPLNRKALAFLHIASIHRALSRRCDPAQCFRTEAAAVGTIDPSHVDALADEWDRANKACAYRDDGAYQRRSAESVGWGRRAIRQQVKRTFAPARGFTSLSTTRMRVPANRGGVERRLLARCHRSTAPAP